MNLKELQEQVGKWGAHNFPDTKPYQTLLGTVEEVGEFAHAHLKAEQKIRKNENHEDKKKDSIGDIIIFLAHYCALSGYDLQEIVEKTWAHVGKRDWIKFPNNGLTE